MFGSVCGGCQATALHGRNYGTGDQQGKLGKVFVASSSFKRTFGQMGIDPYGVSVQACPAIGHSRTSLGRLSS